ncbi:MAG: tetratricopeptide repeat protein, partial [Anaerolineae bacterium]|nr:tetratricopeptide repeat protein [Anaerolineae bacterium]
MLLALLWLFQTITTAIWLRQDNRYPVADTAVTLVRAFRVADVLAHPSLDWISRIVDASGGQPPLYYVITAPLVWLFGRGADSATLINLALLALLLASTAGLAAGLLRRPPGANNTDEAASGGLARWTALGAAIILSFFPLVFTWQRVYNPVFGLLTVVALAVWLLISSNGFASRRHALGFGLAAAAGMWVATTFWFYLLLPALIVAAQAVRTPRPPAASRRTPSKNRLEWLGRRLRLAPAHINLAGAFLLSLLGLTFFLVSGVATTQPLSSRLAGINLLDDALGGFFLLLLLIGLVVAVIQLVRPTRPGARLAFGLLLVALGGGLLLGSLFGAMRSVPAAVGLVLPLLPMAAVLVVLWWPLLASWVGLRRGGESGALVGRRAFIALGAVAALVAAVNFVVISWGAPAVVQTAVRATPAPADLPLVTGAPLLAPGRAVANQYTPQSSRWLVSAVGQAVADRCPEGDTCTVAVLPCLSAFSPEAFAYFTAQASLDDRLQFDPVDPGANAYLSLVDADFIVGKTGDDGCDPLQSSQDVLLVRSLAAGDGALAGRFQDAGQFGPLPDGSDAWIRQRTGAPLDELPFDQQVALLENVLEVTPDSDQALQRLAGLFDESGDSVRALALREEAVQRIPDDVPARLALGSLYLRNGHILDAIGQFETGLSLTGPDDNDARLDLYLQLAAANEELAHWDEVESYLLKAVETGPDDYDARIALGRFYVEQERFADASQALLEARRIDPDRSEAYLLLARAQLLRDDLAGAEDLFNQARALAPGSAEPLIVWGDALRGRGDVAGATDLYSQAAELEPDNVTAYLRWVNALIDGGDTEQAEGLIVALTRDRSDSAEVLEGAGSVFSRLGRDEDAAIAFGRVLGLLPGNTGARVALANTLIALGRLNAAQETLAEGMALAPDRPELLTAEGDLLALRRDSQGAIAAYESALAANPAYWQAADGLARLYLAQGRPDRALDVAVTARGARPDAFHIHAVEGDALRALGRTDEALDAYRQAATLAPPPASVDRETETVPDENLATFLAELQTRIGNVYLLQRNISGAEASFRRALSYDPQHALAYVGQGRMYLAQATQRLRQAGVTGVPAEPVAEDANFFNAVDAFQSALLFDPEAIQAHVGLGDLYLSYGQLNSAVSSYQEALRRDPSLVTVRDKMYSAYLAQGRGDEVVSFYQGLLRQSPDDVAALAAVADALVATGQARDAIDTIDLFLSRNPDNFEALMTLGNLLVDLCPDGVDTAGQPAGFDCDITLQQAITAYDRAAGVDSTTPAPLIDKATTLRLLNRTDEAETAYHDAIAAIEALPDGPTGSLYQAYTGLARLLAGQGRYDEAEAVAQQVATLRPDVSAVAILTGDLLRARGRQVEALAAYSQAVQLAPDDALANSRVGDMLLATGRLDEARAAYEIALTTSPGDRNSQLGMARTLTQMYTDQERTARGDADLARARSLLENALVANPDDTAAQLALGDTLLAQGEAAEAVDLYQSVLAQQPDNSAVIDSLAQALLAAGSPDDALASYAAAIDAAETDAEKARWQLALASTLRSLERLDEAEQAYLAVQLLTPDDTTAGLALGNLYLTQGRADEAITVFEQLVEIDPNDPRISLALGTAYLRQDDLDSADSVAQAMVDRSPSAYQSYLLIGRVAQARDDAPAALAALRQAASLAPTNAALQSQVGDVFLEAGRLDDAATAYNTALSLDRRSVPALTGLGRVYQRQNLFNQAETALRRALDLAPNDPGALSSLGRTLLSSGHAADAIPLLEQATELQAARQETVPVDTLTALADAYLAADQIDEGLAIYLERLDLDPEQAPLVIAQALLGAGQNERAVETMQQYAAERPEDPAALALLGLVLRQSDRVEESLEPLAQAIELDPDYLPAYIQQGDALLDLGRADEAETSYRVVVDRLQGTPNALAAAPPADPPPVFETIEPWRAWTGLARALQIEGRLDEALALAREVEGQRPEVLQTPLLVGDLLRAQGDYDGAQQAYDRAVAVAPRSAVPVVRQADTYLRSGDLTAAQERFEAALSLDPTNADGLLGLARAYSLAGGGTGAVEFRKAEARLKEAIEFAPDNVASYQALGDLYLAYDRPEEAVAQYELARQLATTDLFTLGRLGSALLAAGKPADAIAVLEQRVTQALGDKGALLDLAAAYRAVGDFDSAEASYNQLLTLAPDDLGVKISLGDLYMERDEPERALSLYEEAATRASDPDQLAQARDQLGKAALRLGDTARAESLATSLIDSRPDLARGYLLLASVRESQGDLEGALAV